MKPCLFPLLALACQYALLEFDRCDVDVVLILSVQLHVQVQCLLEVGFGKV